LRAQHHHEQGDALTRTTMERALLIIVVMALVSGAAPGLIDWLYGAEFAPAGPVLRRLALGSGAHAAAGFGVVVLIAGGAPRLCVLVGPIVMALAVAGHLLFIPLGGALAAATVTAACGGVGLLIVLSLVWWRHRVAPRASYVLRVGLLAGLAYGSLAWAAPNAWLAPIALVGAGLALVPATLALRLIHWADVRSAVAAMTPSRG
jgi:O-antigen/teichoic acid export membrane protein